MVSIMFILLGSMFFVYAAGCPNQECVCGYTYLICKNQKPLNGQPVVGIQGTTIPPLDIDLDHAAKLSRGMLPPNLTEFYLTSSPVTLIDDDIFNDSSTTLETISLTSCQLPHISEVFLNLKALKYISITDTAIQNWSSAAMMSIAPGIETVTFSNVGFKEWPSWLKYFSHVTELSFISSDVSSIPDDAFDSMSKTLTSLTLNNNKFTAVPKAISGLTNLQILYLHENMISDLTWLPQSKSLSVLSLNSNRLSNSTHLSDSLFPFAKTLTDVDLQDNHLTSIPNLDFLVEVGRLDFTSNRLSNPNLGSLPPTVYELDLGSNLFHSIPGIFFKLQYINAIIMPSNYVTQIQYTDIPLWLKEVELQSNLITEITDTSFPQNSSIAYLLLDNNPLEKISNSAFNYLVRLTKLSLKNTKLTRLPFALASLANLISFDVSESPGLVCTCMEKSLRKWITSMTKDNVVGNCGQSSVYSFFADLTIDCPSSYNIL